MRVVFLGTPEFACPSLRALVDAGHEVALVVTQPDRARGRGQKRQPSPVRALAQELALANTTLEKGRAAREAAYDEILALSPDVAVVVAFGHILREPLLHGPRFDCVNVHASLLPRWRGPAPIHRAIVAGDDETGVSIMRLEAGVDTGPVYTMRSTRIGSQETTLDLHDRLATLGAQALVATLEGLGSGTAEASSQPEEGVTHAPLLRREEGSVDFSDSAQRVHDRIRGLLPWPAVRVRHGDRTLKLLRSRVVEDVPGAGGRVVDVDEEGILIACGGGDAVLLTHVQPEARGAMSAGDYARGYHLRRDERLLPLADFTP